MPEMQEQFPAGALMAVVPKNEGTPAGNAASNFRRRLQNHDRRQGVLRGVGG